MPADPDAAAWLASLATTLPRHHAVLAHLLDGVRNDARVVQLSVACSLARGVADELSLEPAAWPDALTLVDSLVTSAGEIVALLNHHWPGSGAADSRRTAAIYADGIQLDLMAWPASVWSGMRPPDAVVLHATRNLYPTPWDPTRAQPLPDRLHEWHFLAWWSLLDAHKYLQRNSPWEARQRIEEARTHALQLAAAQQHTPFPEHAITSILDTPHATLPDQLPTTAPTLDTPSMHTALIALADILDHVAPQHADTTLSVWVRRRIRDEHGRTRAT